VVVSSATGEATCDQTYETPGTHLIGATYSGDAKFSASSATPVTELISGATPLACEPGVSNTTFVCHAFEDLLSRAPGAIELAGYLELLSSGANRTQVAFDIVTSAEYRDDLVASIYERFLVRAPDAGGLALFTSLLSSGTSDQQVSSDLVGSTEFFDRAGSTDALFLTLAYKTVLGRTPDPDGTATFLGLLAAGETRTEIAYDLLTSTEYRLDTIASSYQHLLGRQPSPADFVTQLAFLASGGTVEQFISNIVGSAEFYSAPTS
jgi:hypothetical protein